MDSRRNILKVLGLTSVGLVSSEAVATPIDGMPSGGVPKLAKYGVEFQTRMAKALESLAKEIRAGNVAVVDLNVNSAATVDTFLEHTVKIKVELLHDES